MYNVFDVICVAGGVRWRPGWRTCPCSTSRNRRAPYRTRPSSNNSCYNNSNSADRHRSAGWRTTVVAVRAVRNCRFSSCCITNRMTRNERLVPRLLPEPKCVGCSEEPISSPQNSPNFARELFIQSFFKKQNNNHFWVITGRVEILKTHFSLRG